MVGGEETKEGRERKGELRIRALPSLASQQLQPLSTTSFRVVEKSADRTLSPSRNQIFEETSALLQSLQDELLDFSSPPFSSLLPSPSLPLPSSPGPLPLPPPSSLNPTSPLSPPALPPPRFIISSTTSSSSSARWSFNLVPLRSSPPNEVRSRRRDRIRRIYQRIHGRDYEAVGDEQVW